MGAIPPHDQRLPRALSEAPPYSGQRRGGLLSEDDNENRPDTERHDRFTS